MTEQKITSGGKEYVPQAGKVLGRAFRDDPAIIYFLCTMSEEARLAYMEAYMTTLTKADALNEGLIEEINDWQSCSVWLPPGKKIDNTWTLIPSGFLEVLWKAGFRGCKRMLGEFAPKSDATKNKYMGDREFHYLFLIGTEEEHRRQGLSSALIKRYQDRLLKLDKPLPIWLEATTENSMKLYLKLGFKTMDSIVLGKGVVGTDGRPKEGGDGVTIWAMLWEPPGQESAA